MIHSPLPRKVNLQAGLQQLAAFFVQLLLACVVLTCANPAFAQGTRKAKFTVQPQYPELARKNNIRGSARLEVLIAPDGTIKDIKVLGGSPLLVEASIEALKKWKYEAASSESTVVLKFDFKP